MDKKTKGSSLPHLSKREREVLDYLYRAGDATAGEVQSALVDAPGYSGVRTILRVLVEKGHVIRDEREKAHRYLPAVAAERVRRPSLFRVIDTFFAGSGSSAIVGLLEDRDLELSEEELGRIQRAVKRRLGDSDETINLNRFDD